MRLSFSDHDISEDTGGIRDVDAPDVLQFEIGTALPDGTFDPKPSWDTLNEKLVFEWGAWLPNDVSNLGGVCVFIHLPSGDWVKAPQNNDWVAPEAGAAYRDAFAISGDDIPKTPESWTFVCCPANALGTFNVDGDGDPTGPSVTMNTIAPNKGITDGNLSSSFQFDLAKAKPSTLSTAAFASSIEPYSLVTAIPDGNGQLVISRLTSTVFNLYDEKLYRWDSSIGKYRRKVVEGDIESNSIGVGILKAGVIRTQELAVTELLLGPGGDKPPRMAIRDALGNLRGFIGIGEDGTSFNWFPDMRIGTNINAPTIYASASGVQISGASISVTSGGDVITINATDGIKVANNGLGSNCILSDGKLSIQGSGPNVGSYTDVQGGSLVVHTVDNRTYQEWTSTYGSSRADVYALSLRGTEVIDSSRVLKNVTLPTHTHAESDVTNLVTDLAGKAAASHTHDDRYYLKADVYTKAEVDALLLALGIPFHTHGGTTDTSLDHTHTFTSDGPN